MAEKLKQPLVLTDAEKERLEKAVGFIQSARLLTVMAYREMLKVRGFSEAQADVATAGEALERARNSVKNRRGMVNLLSSTGMGTR